MISSIRRAALTSQAEGYERNLHLAEDYLLERGISLEAAQMFRLGFDADGDYEKRLAIPYWTPAGVVNLKMRCTKHIDCNAQVLVQTSDTVVVTEGELDAICVQAYCGIPAVAYPGTESWKAHHHWRYCFEGIAEVIVVADGDDAGQGAAKKVADSIGMAARVVNLPTGMDSNQFIQERGANAFAEYINR
jgi:DNA primase